MRMNMHKNADSLYRQMWLFCPQNKKINLHDWNW